MAVNFGNVTQLGLIYQQYPPPLLPKPGKNNVRLQKLLKKTAKKKAAPQASQTPAPFRSSLSPVNEASPDLEHSDHSTPPRTPETPSYGGTLHPRFSVRPLYQHSPSSYPHLRGTTYGKTARLSPQPYVAPGHIFPHKVTPVFSYAPPPQPTGVSPVPGPGSYAAAPIAPALASSVPAVPPPALAPVSEIVFPSATKPDAVQASVQAQPPESHVHTKNVEPSRSLTPTVITSIAPQLTIFDTTRTSKPMFDVPQITLYTAKTSGVRTSYYGTSKTTITRSKTPTSEIKRGGTPTSEVKRLGTPTSEISEVRRGTTPIPEIKRGTTPTSEIKRGTTPTSEVKRIATPTPETKRAVTPTPETKRVKTPTYYFLSSKTPSGRPKTPSHVSRAKTPVFEISKPNPLLFAVSPVHMEGRRSKTPTSMIGDENLKPSVSEELKERDLPAKTLNGETHLKSTSSETPVAEAPTTNLTTPEIHIHEATTENLIIPEIRINEPPTSKTPLSEASRPKTPTHETPKPTSLNGYQRPKTPSHEGAKPAIAQIGYQRPKTPSYEPAKPPTPQIGYQRQKTPSYEPAKPATSQIGYQRPKTPTYGTSKSRVPPFAGQRPKTPTYGTSIPKPKSYYGLTPAEYVAYGGIQRYSPTFGLSRSRSPTVDASKPEMQESALPKPPTHGIYVEQTTVQEMSKPKAPSEGPERPKTPLSKVPTSKSPTIENGTSVVATPPDVPKSMVTSVKTKATVVETPKTLVTEVKQCKTQIISDVKTASEIPRVKTPSSEVPKLKTPTSETQRPRTPIYGVPKPKTPTSETVILPTKTESKTISPFLKAKTPDQDSTKMQLKETVTETSIAQQAGLSKETSKPKIALSEAKPAGTEHTTSSPLPQATSEHPAAGKCAVQPPAKPKDDQDNKVKPVKADAASVKASDQQEGKLAAEKEEGDNFPKAEPLLKVIQKPKGMKSKLSGWSRLKKHMVVETEEPAFPEPESESKKEVNGIQQKPSEQKTDEKEPSETSDKSESQGKDSPRATKMWDAVLFQMFSTKENIMQQIEANKSEEQKKEEKMIAHKAPKEIPAFAHRLPVLLFSPRFDAKKLREAASRPLTKIATVFEMGLIGRKNKDEEPKDFNRTARGFGPSKTTDDD